MKYRVAVGVIDQIVGAVESFALIVRCQRCGRAVRLEASNQPIAMAAHDQPPFAVEHQPVGSGFATGGLGRTGVAGGFSEDADALVGMPRHNLVAGNVREKQALCSSRSRQALRPIRTRRPAPRFPLISAPADRMPGSNRSILPRVLGSCGRCLSCGPDQDRATRDCCESSREECRRTSLSPPQETANRIAASAAYRIVAVRETQIGA